MVMSDDDAAGSWAWNNGPVYVPPKFVVDEEAAWRIVDDAGAGLVVVQKPEGLASVFVPVLVSEDRRTILAHVAKANSWWRDVADGTEVLALFLAASAYVSPSNYPSRSENPNVVPTWNYVAAEVRGRVSVHPDPAWLLDQVRALTRHFETGRDPEWRVDDMDAEYRSGQLKAIVGVAIDVESIEGKVKLSQNRPDVDRLNVRDAFAEGSLSERNVARLMRDDS